MKILTENVKDKLSVLLPILPYGVLESWDDLNPRLYHAIHIYWLKFYGLWYNNFSPLNILFWIQIIYTIIILWLVCFLPIVGEIVYLLKPKENIGDIAEGLYLFLSEVYTYFKIVVFWLNKDKVMNLIQYLYCEEFKPIEAEHKEFIRKSIRTARWVMTYYTIMCVGAVSVGIIMPITENFDILPTNVEYPYFNVYTSPAYQILYVHHIYYKPATCIIDGVMDTILASFISSTIGQIEILAFNLRNFDVVAERRRKRAINERKATGAFSKDYHIHTVLRDCIIHHNSIIRYVSMIENAFSLASVLQFMLSVMVLCLVGVQFLSIENPSSHPMQIMWMAIYLTCMLFEVFIYCWFGDELIWKSIDLRHAAFEGPWLNASPETRKYIIIFLERCKRPLTVTAGKIFILSLDTYTILINWAYKAFAVMSNMKK
ncbi:odorant receptor 46a-like [Achroia grisella]|uniref:odorant receptor 46a-like n=1 Tax=Achroia grisella TaxID=688607 RepID=UPI0027D30317|nr:odorant receptor 46a-like [Achroia grisella]